MKIVFVTKTREKEAKERLVRKIQFGMLKVWEEYECDESGVCKGRNFRPLAEEIAAADDVVLNSYTN